MNRLAHSINHRIERNATSCAEHPWVPAVARVLAASDTRHPAHTRFALLVALCLLGQPRSGRVLVERRALSGLLGVEEPTVDSWLADLEAAEQLAIESRGGYLVLRLRMWAAERPAAAHERGSDSAEARGESATRTPPSGPPPSALHFKSPASAPAEQTGAEPGEGVRGPGSEEGGLEEFLDRLHRIVGAPDERASYRAFCRRYPRPVLEAALARVADAGNIRKSRGALFTYLVKKLA